MNPTNPPYDFRNHISSQSVGERCQALMKLVRTWEQCRECSISGASLSRVVVGEGPPDPVVIFIAEAPGAVEAVRNRPLVGPAGKIFRETLLKGIEEISFLANILACRPLDGISNRQPSPYEIHHCLPRLTGLMQILQPSVIVLLGSTAKDILAPVATRGVISDEKILAWKIQECIIDWVGTVAFTYHPSYVLRCGGFDQDPLTIGMQSAKEQYERINKMIREKVRERKQTA